MDLQSLVEALAALDDDEEEGAGAGHYDGQVQQDEGSLKRQRKSGNNGGDMHHKIDGGIVNSGEATSMSDQTRPGVEQATLAGHASMVDALLRGGDRPGALLALLARRGDSANPEIHHTPTQDQMQPLPLAILERCCLNKNRYLVQHIITHAVAWDSVLIPSTNPRFC
jgi:hypothetical protein